MAIPMAYNLRRIPGYTAIQPVVDRFERFPTGSPKAERPDLVMTCPVCRRPNTFVYARDLTEAQYDKIATAARERKTIPHNKLVHRCVKAWRTT